MDGQAAPAFELVAYTTIFVRFQSGLCSWLADFLLENSLNHKLRVLVRVDLDPGRVTLEIGGCLTQANFPVLLHLLLRAQRLATGPSITLDFRDSTHLEPSVVSYLQHVALPESLRDSEPADVHHELGNAAAALEGAETFELTLLEPDELPVCPIHSGEADLELVPGVLPLTGAAGHRPLPGGKLAGLVEAGSAR